MVQYIAEVCVTAAYPDSFGKAKMHRPVQQVQADTKPHKRNSIDAKPAQAHHMMHPDQRNTQSDAPKLEARYAGFIVRSVARATDLEGAWIFLLLLLGGPRSGLLLGALLRLLTTLPAAVSAVPLTLPLPLPGPESLAANLGPLARLTGVTPLPLPEAETRLGPPV